MTIEFDTDGAPVYDPDDDWRNVGEWEMDRREARNRDRAPAAPAPNWAPVDLEAYLTGTHEPETTTFLRRSDALALWYAGRTHSLSGEPESGKGWIVCAAAAQFLRETSAGAFLYVDFEDTPDSVTRRLLALGLKADEIRARFIYVRPDGPVVRRGQLDELIASIGDDVWIVVLDGVTEGMVLHGLDPLSNTDIARWRELVVRPLRDAIPGGQSTAVVEIDHVVKDKDQRGRYALGGIHKLAGVDVAYGVKVLEPFGRGRSGKLKITVNKDRPGYVRGFATDGVAAIVDVESTGDDHVRVELRAADRDSQGRADTFRPTYLMESVSRALEEHDGLSKRALRDTVKGRAKYVDDALELLVADGYVRQAQDGQAVRHHVERPYREAEDPHRVPVSAPCPDRVPDTGEGDRVPVSPPIGTRDTGHAPDDDDTASAELLDLAERFASRYPEAAA